MNSPASPQALPNGAYVEIIDLQTQIVKLGMDLGQVMELITDRIRRLTAATGAVVELAEGEEMVYRASSGLAKPQLGLRLARKGSLSGLCVESATVLRCDDSETDERVDREACRKVGLRSMVVTPLLHEGSVVGVLKILSDRPAAFGERDVEVLRILSELIAAAMFHATKFQSDQLYHMATHDPLTGLANRALFHDRLRQNLSRAQRRNELIGILNLDMDGLKQINDRHGHRAGDAAIKETAIRIQRMTRDSDTVARMGGDEFAVILNGVNGRDNVVRQSQSIGEQIGRPFAFEGNELHLAASVGTVVYPEDGGDVDALLEKADQDMYWTKRRRKGEAGADPPPASRQMEDRRDQRRDQHRRGGD